MLERILVLCALAFSFAYGVKQKHSGFREDYFDAALCGTAALLLSRIYYFCVFISNGSDEILTVGILGQVSAYLFFLAANTKFIPDSPGQKKICIPGISGTAVICAGLLFAAVKAGMVSAYIGEGIYMLGMGSTFYAAVRTICRSRKSVFCRSVCGFSVCVCLLILTNVINEIALFTEAESIRSILHLIETAISVPVIIGMLPVLRKGMKTWYQ